MFIVVILLLLVLSVFGNSLNLFILEHLPFLSGTADWLIEARTIISPAVLVIFCLLIYKFLPEPERQASKAASGGGVRGSWMDGGVLDIFCISGYIQGIFQYVREPYYDRADYAVDVFLHVQYTAWRGAECAAV